MDNLDRTTVQAKIDEAAERVGRVWPLYSDVGANPLSGFEDRPFREAVEAGEELFGGRGYPTPEQFRTAWEDGAIDPDILSDLLADHGFDDDPEALLDRMEEGRRRRTDADTHDATLNRVLCKWLAAFLDQGQAAWSMPDREDGFYRAWREVAMYDSQIPESTTPVASYYRERLTDAPETAFEAIFVAVNSHPEAAWVDIFEHHLAALPGWVGLIKQRTEANNNPWQEAYPITLVDYLGVRLILAKHMGVDLKPDEPETGGSTENLRLQELWLTAWERSYQQTLVGGVKRNLDRTDADAGTGRPRAQLVFCIDTRSEIIRRHLEATGDYETYGYAGFFGVPIEYQGYESPVRTDSCPVMVDPKHHVTERARDEERASVYERWHHLRKDGGSLLKSLKNDLVAAFGFVEAAGTFFGTALTARTLLPAAVHDLGERLGAPHPGSFGSLTLDETDADATGDAADPPVGISTEQKAFYAEAAFDLMGWAEFAPVVVFTGHQSQTANNPYESSIDCGACAGSPGTPNARTLASICNEPAVRDRLRDRGIDIPDDTVFIAAEHNTTTDDVTLFTDGRDLDAGQRDIVERLRDDLDRAQAGAAEERLRTMGADADDSVREVERRTSDWAEPRPELGLSGNAGFVVGPRALTTGVDLGGRSFLHSYDWETDPDGEALENIMSGPLVVCQMINAQYYFSTVDNEIYGSGSKTTHNAVGNVGVLQGNGGDLMRGLPLQSLYADDREPYHEPLRLSVLIHAPVDRVTGILERNDDIAALLDNGWLALTVMDPEQENACFRYQEGLEWEPLDERVSAPTPAPTVG